MAHDKTIEARGAAKMMEDFYMHYGQMKRLESKTDYIKDIIRKELDRMDIKRVQYDGVAGKYVACNVYETNHVALNDYLNDIGILPHVAQIDLSLIKDSPEDFIAVEPFLIPGRKYVRFSPNKAGRTPEEDFSHLGEDPHLLISQWSSSRQELVSLEKNYETLKRKMLKCSILQQERKLPLHYGSVSLLDGKPSFDSEAVYAALGDHFLIQYGKVDMEQLDNFIAMGFLKKMEVDQFRRLVDVRLRFVLISEEDEAKMFAYFHDKTRRLSKLSIAG
ncbi:hypothetical protein SAMN04487897_13111 [Paenibacillus sp. yr247]|uniref:hypothetical protein n=1 Tax=Paenibacillus sp. yr247 TaxID=1761880 RepID=UPI00088AEAFE|nr:hypothetical protein [Paenibacillus sp. yr247]SDP01921.1 hypothetical protein SAMN04487897_13111 [Paenibacillus sp. yr247]